MKVLLLEDHADTAEMVVEVFEMYSVPVVVCGDAKTLEECLENSFDLVLMDLSLGSPEEIVKTIKSKTSAPIYLVSGSSDIQNLAKKTQVDGYLQKPYELMELEELIQKFQNSKS